MCLACDVRNKANNHRRRDFANPFGGVSLLDFPPAARSHLRPNLAGDLLSLFRDAVIGESADEKVAKQGNHGGPYQGTYRLPEQITKADVTYSPPPTVVPSKAMARGNPGRVQARRHTMRTLATL